MGKTFFTLTLFRRSGEHLHDGLERGRARLRGPHPERERVAHRAAEEDARSRRQDAVLRQANPVQ